jgi:hypothetical protein
MASHDLITSSYGEPITLPQWRNVIHELLAASAPTTQSISRCSPGSRHGRLPQSISSGHFPKGNAIWLINAGFGLPQPNI